MPSDKQIAEKHYDYHQQQLLAVFAEIQQYFTEPPAGYKPLGLPPLGKLADKAINVLNDALAAARQPEQGAQAYDLGRHDERRRTMQLIGAVRMDAQTGATGDMLDRLVMSISSEPLNRITAAAPTETAAPQPREETDDDYWRSSVCETDAQPTPPEGKCRNPDWEGGIEVSEHSYDKDGFCNYCGNKRALPAAPADNTQALLNITNLLWESAEKECDELHQALEACWHCGVLLTPASKPRCESCPEECDVEGCQEMGCAPTTETAAPAAPADEQRGSIAQRLLLRRLYETECQLPNRNYAKGHSFEEWLLHEKFD